MTKQINIAKWRETHKAGAEHAISVSAETIANMLYLLSEGFDGNQLQSGMCLTLLWILGEPDATSVIKQMSDDIQLLIELGQKEKAAKIPTA